MSSITLREGCEDVCTEGRIMELIKGDPGADTVDLTNVYRLRVERAQCLLGRLQASIEGRAGGEATPIALASKEKAPTVEAVLAETCSLVRLLEADLGETQTQADVQRRRVRGLLDKIEGLSAFRMEMMPVAVQREHEACANDIYELQWHIKHKSNVERKIREKRNKAKDINDQLKEEIEEIKEYIPLVEEKLRLETETLARIDETRRRLTQEAEASADRVQMTQSKHDESSKKAEAERQHIKRELHNSNKLLVKTQKGLLHATKEHQKMEDYRWRTEEKIKQNHLQIGKLNSENAAKDTEQSIYEGLVGGLESKMRELSFDSRRLTDDRDKKKVEFEEQEAKQSRVVADMVVRRSDLDQQLTTLKRDNKQTEVEIDSLKDSAEKCVLDTEKMRERIQTTRNEIVEAESGYEEGLEEFSKESRNHALVKQRLTSRMKEIQEVEDKLRKTLSEVENQIKQEILTKASVKSKMSTDVVDLEKSKKEAIEKQNQMKRMLKEALALVKEVRAQVAQVDAQHKTTSEELHALVAENKKMLAEQEQMRKEKSGCIEELTPTHEDLRVRVATIVQKDEHIQWQVGTMNSQLLEMSASEKLIVKAKKKMQETLLEIEREYNLHAVDVEVLRRHQSKLTAAMSQMQSQASRMRATHNQYLQEREDALAAAQRELEEALVDNKKLARQYRTSQTDFYGMQDAYLDVVQEHLRGEGGLKDMKEIQRLQRHMHNAMEAFFTMKLMYDEDQFEDLQRRCSHNLDEIELLKQKYMNRIEDIKLFLEETFPRES